MLKPFQWQKTLDNSNSLTKYNSFNIEFPNFPYLLLVNYCQSKNYDNDHTSTIRVWIISNSEYWSCIGASGDKNDIYSFALGY